MLGVFGSYARSEETKNSDIDLLIDSKTQYNLLDLIGVEQELTEKLGVKVDLITLRSINASLKTYIDADLIRFV